MAAVELHGIGKVFPGGIVALRDVSITVHPGEVFALIGPSGSGKSTLLRLVAGLEEPSSGEMAVEKRNLSGVPPHRRGVSYLPQRPALYPGLTGVENLVLGRKINPLLLAQTAEQLQIDDVLNRRPDQLSGGQIQRIALGRTLLRPGPVFLLDEPFASLDGPLRWDVRSILALLSRQRSATIIFVTHDQEEALSLADRLTVVERGVILQTGTPADLLNRPATVSVARLLGWPPMTLVRGKLTEGSSGLGFEGGSISRATPCQLGDTSRTRCARGLEGGRLAALLPVRRDDRRSARFPRGGC